jgi:uncharacterized protein
MLRVEVRKPTDAEKKTAATWPVWNCDPSEFEWSYAQAETCHILAGQVEVETEDETIKFGPGDWVVFPQGLDCVWKVKQAVKKHYRMGN